MSGQGWRPPRHALTKQRGSPGSWGREPHAAFSFCHVRPPFSRAAQVKVDAPARSPHRRDSGRRRHFCIASGTCGPPCPHPALELPHFTSSLGAAAAPGRGGVDRHVLCLAHHITCVQASIRFQRSRVRDSLARHVTCLRAGMRSSFKLSNFKASLSLSLSPLPSPAKPDRVLSPECRPPLPLSPARAVGGGALPREKRNKARRCDEADEAR